MATLHSILTCVPDHSQIDDRLVPLKPKAWHIENAEWMNNKQTNKEAYSQVQILEKQQINSKKIQAVYTPLNWGKIYMEKAMPSHSSTFAWKIPWTEELGGLQSMGSHDWATSLSLLTFMHWRRKWQPLQCSCLENPRDGEAWWAAVSGVTQSRTQLKRLSSSTSKIYMVRY